MSFYQSFASYYDRIFPLNPVALNFVANHFQKGESILDIGAGTGNMAIALANEGYNVSASEPDQEMVEWIRSKAKESRLAIYTQTMLEINLINGSFDGILCIGNTLPHLQNLKEIEDFLEKCINKLNPGGKLILQLVNYDQVLSNDNFSFPVIEKEDFTFTRNYMKKEDHILFTTKLKGEDLETENTIALFPVTSKQLITIINKLHFENVEIMGSFKGEQYSVDSKAMIIVARKGQ
ncbi:methyltransferase family protein [Ureibacillus xyleni]|uniref:Methyltransferase family protein n=1 Tax=Ureibacillus xyleni TaxID=614648 RepID=A0A285S5Y9_9BACL|nr:class I SAM-dependent methyltransferase [Ureibacillus xyleni]SOC02770.1 methyltransferase family protein [Ureibacillus xyleni]